MNQYFRRLFLLVCLVSGGDILALTPLVVGSSIPGEISDSESGKPKFAEDGRVFLAIGLIWEGLHIRNLNTVAIRKFRQEFAHIPLVHFISPAYFSRAQSSLRVS